MVFLAVLWAFIPGELVMKSGKLLSYKGKYKIEGDQINFTSATGASLKVPVSSVDIEKTKAREALLDKKNPAPDRRSRSEREFGDFVADNPPRKVEVTAPTPDPEPVETLVLDADGNWVDPEEMGWPSELTVVNLYVIDSGYNSGSDHYSGPSDYEQKRNSYQARYRALQEEKNRIQSRLAKKKEANNKPDVNDVNEDEEGNTSSKQSYQHEKDALSRINERIRELEREAMFEGIDLN